MVSLSDRYALAVHLAIAEKLRSTPEEVLRIANRNLDRWISSGDFDRSEMVTLQEWKEILESNGPDEIANLITSRTDEGQRLRSSSPFVGILTYEERDRTWSECAEIGLA